MLWTWHCHLTADHPQASNPTHSTVASRIQAFQDGQCPRSPKPAGQTRKAAERAEIDSPHGRVNRATTTFAAPKGLPSSEGTQSNRHDGRPKSDGDHHETITGNAGGRKRLNDSLPARPATNFESVTPLQQYKASIPSKQSPERRDTQRRQASLDTQSITQIRLSEARARLRSVGHETTENLVVPSRGMNVSPVRRKGDIHQLQDIIDNAIAEQPELDIVGASARQSPHLRSIISQVELRMTSPSKRQLMETEWSGSPSRRGRDAHSPSRPRTSVPGPASLGGKNSDHPWLSSSQQTSPSRKQRLSTESILPRSSIDSEPSATSACSSVYPSPKSILSHEVSRLQPMLLGAQAPSPVKLRTAAFEKMVQHDKQIMYQQQHKHNGNACIKKHCWLDSLDNSRANHVQRVVDLELNANKTGRNTKRDPATISRNFTSTSNTGPIPLALPQLISSRGRAVSTSSQFDDSFDTLPQSEAALSRLSSRVQPPRAVPKASGAQDIGKEAKSPFFRWKPFMLDKKFPHQTVPALPQESSHEANARGGNVTSQHESYQKTAEVVVQSKDPPQVSTTRHSNQDSKLPQVLAPERLTFCNNVSPKQDYISVDAAVKGTMMQQADGAQLHCEAPQTVQRCSSGDVSVDDGKESAVSQSNEAMDKYGDLVIASEIDPRSSRPRSKDLTPTPLIPVEANGSAPASGPGSPVRGRAPTRTLYRHAAMVKDEDSGDCVRVSRSRSKAGNVRVTVEVRTPQGSPMKAHGDKDGAPIGDGNRKGDRVVIVTTDVQGDEEE